MKAAFILLALLTINVVLSEKTNFEDWKKNNNIDYSQSNKTESDAEKTYKTNVAKIAENNKNTKATFVQGVNDAADQTKEERDKRRGIKPGDNKHVKGTPFAPKVMGNPPASLSYVSQMTPIKDQGSCGSCWAFATISTLEYKSKKDKTNFSLSEQNLVDCDKRSKGCNGGHMVYALNYAINSGISDGKTGKYVYKGKGGSCRRPQFPSIFQISKACGGNINGDETLLKKILVAYGPMTTSINSATPSDDFDFLKTGIYNGECSSDPNKADHAVTIVGYTANYWIIRNSWGTTWGDKGYGKLKMGRNCCGLANAIYGPC